MSPLSIRPQAASAFRGEAYTAEGCPMRVGLVRTQFDGTAKCRSRRDQYLAVIRSNNSAVVLSQSWLTYGDTVSERGSCSQRGCIVDRHLARGDRGYDPRSRREMADNS
jgi:hypothetical protein